MLATRFQVSAPLNEPPMCASAEVWVLRQPVMSSSGMSACTTSDFLRAARDDATRVTNLFSGRPARGLVNRLIETLGPLNPAAPAFPQASAALAPLRAAAEARGSGDFSPLWAGEAAGLAREMDAGALTETIWREALACAGGLDAGMRQAEAQAK